MLINWQGLHPIYYQCHSCYHSYIVNYRKCSWVINFANFVNFQPFQKIFMRKVWICDKVFTLWLQEHLMEITPAGISCWIHKELSPRRYLQSSDCFAESCELQRKTVYSEYYVNQPGLYQICEHFSMKSSKIFISKECLDLWKLNTIHYNKAE